MDTEEDVKAKAAARTKAAKAEVTGAAGAAKLPEGASPSGRYFEVRGPDGGRHRAGYKFTAVPLRIAAELLTEAQIALIEGDPLLSVKWIVVDDEETAPRV